jgi:benzaldehyde dehydrogenase (NAD)
MTIETLLTPASVWTAKIYSNGWKTAGLGTEMVLEKATGVQLGEIGIASPEDISAAATTARTAQRNWAQLPAPLRGDVLREFSRLVLVHAEEINSAPAPTHNALFRHLD